MLAPLLLLALSFSAPAVLAAGKNTLCKFYHDRVSASSLTRVRFPQSPTLSRTVQKLELFS